MKKSLALFLVIALVLPIAVGCAPKIENPAVGTQAPSAASGLLTIGITEPSGNFNPLYYSSTYDGNVVDLVFDRLISRNFEGEYEPNVAESWEFTNENKSILFKLKKDISFSDGTPLTAHDVVFTYLVMADPSYTGPYSLAVKDMESYEEYYAKETDKFRGVVALDDYTVQFNFKESLRTNFESCGYSILPKHYYGKDFTPGNTAAVESITSAPIGSGPYVVHTFKEKEHVYLKRSAAYNRSGFMISEIMLKFVDMATDIDELTTGKVDLLAGVIEPKKITEARDKNFSINQYSRSGYGYVKTNCEYGPTADKKVRQALFYAFNTSEFVNSFFYDKDTDQVLATTQFHPFIQTSWAVTPEVLSQLTDYTFNLDKAKALLDEAGWKVGASGFREKDGEVMTLNIAAMPDHDILNKLIQMWDRDWSQGLNIKLNVAYLDFNTIRDYVIFNSDANVKNWSMFFLATTMTTPDPHTICTTFHSDYIGSGKDNTSRYKNPQMDKLIDEAKAILDIEQAKIKYGEILKILSEDAAIMPVYANIYFDLYAPRLVNFKTDSLYPWTSALKDAKVTE